MRIYSQPNKRSITGKNNLIPYFWETRKKQYIFTEDGVKQIEQNKMYNIMIKDVPIVKTLLGAYPVTIDASDFVKVDEEWYQVPPETHPELIVQKVYKASVSMKLEWVFEYDSSGEVLRDNYFYLPPNEDIHASENKADLMKFLNL